MQVVSEDGRSLTTQTQAARSIEQIVVNNFKRTHTYDIEFGW